MWLLKMQCWVRNTYDKEQHIVSQEALRWGTCIQNITIKKHRSNCFKMNVLSLPVQQFVSGLFLVDFGEFVSSGLQ